MLDHLKKYDIVLGSASPRRKELLQMLNFPFRVEVSNADETIPSTIRPIDIAKYLAQTKADAYTLGENMLLITADTVVLSKDKIYGKPKDRQEAIEMLLELSGKKHEVITGVCIKNREKKKLFHSKTKVEFCSLSQTEIEYYVDNYQPFDKAGAYGIQEWIGYIGIKKIKGSYYNVMGLPTDKIYKKLLSFRGIKCFQLTSDKVEILFV